MTVKRYRCVLSIPSRSRHWIFASAAENVNMSERSASDELNVLGEPLQPCNFDPETGYLRDGHCRDIGRDPGRHEICGVMTEDFLLYSKDQGNDLMTPRPEFNFPGLDPGDHWCLCIGRWQEAKDAGHTPPVVLQATARSVLAEVSLETLKSCAAGDTAESD
jgi:uncharacterized protein (DUF2237 family)